MKKKAKEKLEKLKEKFENFWREWKSEKDVIAFLLLEGGKTTTDLARFFGIPHPLMYEMVKALGIESLKKKSPKWYAARLGKTLQTKERLLEWLSKQKETNVSLELLARRLQITPEQLRAQMIRLGIDPDEFTRKPKGTIVPCDYCGTPHFRSPSQLKKQRHFFCSRTCYKKWKKGAKI